MQIAANSETAQLIADWLVAVGTLAAAAAAVGIAIWASKQDRKRRGEEQRRQRRQIQAVFHHAYEDRSRPGITPYVRIVNGSNELVTELRVEVAIHYSDEQGARQWWWMPQPDRYQLEMVYDIAFPGDDFTEYGNVWPATRDVPPPLTNPAHFEASERPALLLCWFDAAGIYWARQGDSEPYESTPGVPGRSLASIRKRDRARPDPELKGWHRLRRHSARRSSTQPAGDADADGL